MAKKLAPRNEMMVILITEMGARAIVRQLKPAGYDQVVAQPLQTHAHSAHLAITKTTLPIQPSECLFVEMAKKLAPKSEMTVTLTIAMAVNLIAHLSNPDGSVVVAHPHLLTHAYSVHQDYIKMTQSTQLSEFLTVVMLSKLALRNAMTAILLMVTVANPIEPQLKPAGSDPVAVRPQLTHAHSARLVSIKMILLIQLYV